MFEYEKKASFAVFFWKFPFFDFDLSYLTHPAQLQNVKFRGNFQNWKSAFQLKVQEVQSHCDTFRQCAA